MRCKYLSPQIGRDQQTKLLYLFRSYSIFHIPCSQNSVQTPHYIHILYIQARAWIVPKWQVAYVQLMWYHEWWSNNWQLDYGWLCISEKKTATASHYITLYVNILWLLPTLWVLIESHLWSFAIFPIIIFYCRWGPKCAIAKAWGCSDGALYVLS